MNTEPKQTFEARYQVDDGYAGGARPQAFEISAEDIEDDMSESDLQDLYHTMCEEDMQQRIGCCVMRVDEFVEWAQSVISARKEQK